MKTANFHSEEYKLLVKVMKYTRDTISVSNYHSCFSHFEWFCNLKSKSEILLKKKLKYAKAKKDNLDFEFQELHINTYLWKT